MNDTADTCPDCGAPVSERVDMNRHWKCGSRPAGLDYPASRSWACQHIERLNAALRRWYEEGDPCERWAAAGFPNDERHMCGRVVGDEREPCLPCKLTWGANTYGKAPDVG